MTTDEGVWAMLALTLAALALAAMAFGLAMRSAGELASMTRDRDGWRTFWLSQQPAAREGYYRD